MSKITLTLAAFLAVLFLVPSGPGSVAAGAPQSCNTFTINNASAHALGDVTISDGSGGGTIITIPGTGTFDTTICYTAVAVEINGQSVDYPNAAVVTLADGSSVKVQWQSTNLVDVVDVTIINKPVQ